VIYFYDRFKFTEDEQEIIITFIKNGKTYKDKDVKNSFPLLPPEVLKVRLMYIFLFIIYSLLEKISI